MGGIVEQVWSAVWGASPLPGRLIVLAILFVLVKALWEGGRQRRRYQREEREIRKVSEWLTEWRAEAAIRNTSSPAGAEPPDAERAETDEVSASGEPDAAPPDSGAEPAGPRGRAAGAPPPHPGLVDLGLLGESIDPESLIGDRIRAIATIRRHRVKVDPGTLQGLALYRDAAARGHGFAGFAGGLCMLLGILGTFVGLSMMVQQIHLGLPADPETAGADSWLTSVQQLKTVLGGMQTAFSTSLVGMVGAIVASTVAFDNGRRRRRVFEALERLTAGALLPAAVPAVEDEVLLAQVSRQLDDSFTRLDEIHRHNRQALEELTAAEEAFVAIIAEVREITRGQSARSLDALLGELARSNQAVLDVSRQIPRIVASFDGAARSLRDGVDQLRVPVPAAARDAGAILGLRPAVWLRILLIGAAIFGVVSLVRAF